MSIGQILDIEECMWMRKSVLQCLNQAEKPKSIVICCQDAAIIWLRVHMQASGKNITFTQTLMSVLANP
eukprot:scaffold293845_cov17-Tisochrysis_lutea.AAC.1